MRPPQTIMFFLALQPAYLFAQSEEDEPKTHMEEIQVTASRHAQTTGDVSASVSLVNDELLKEPGNLTVIDALRGQPGIFVQQTTPGQGVPIIRGLKGSEILHLVDGVRINNAFFRNAPNQYVALIDPRMLGRIEVLRGAGSSFYGSDAMGGVVNMLTRKPSGADDLSGEFSLNYFSADGSLVSHTQFDATSQHADILFDADYVSSGNRTTGSNRHLPTAYTSRAASVKLIGRSDFKWMLNLQYLIQPSTPRVDDLVAGFGQTEPDSQQFLFKPNDRTFAHLKIGSEHKTAFWDNWEGHLSTQLMHDNRLSQGFGSDTIKTEQNRSWSHNASFQASKESNTNFWQYGFDYYFDKVNSARQKTSATSGIATTTNSRFPDGASMEVIGLWASAERSLINNASTTLSLRYSSINTHLPAADRGVAVAVDTNDLSGSIGLHYPINQQWSFNSNLGRGFRAPNIFDLGTLGERPGNRFNIGNPNLKPEYLWSWDAGLRYRGASWRGEWVFFYNDYQDKIISVSTGDLTDDGRRIVRSENASSVKIYGLESQFSYDSGHSLNANLVLNWSFGTTKTNSITEPSDRIPPLNIMAKLNWEFDSGNVLSLEQRASSRQSRLSSRDLTDPRIDPNGTAGWTTTEVRLSSPLHASATQWHIGVSNVFNKAYREHGSGGDAAGIGILLGVSRTF
ncbi:MAG: TonB-dependent receptor plug domain-containing protein [bacterium]